MFVVVVVEWVSHRRAPNYRKKMLRRSPIAHKARLAKLWKKGKGKEHSAFMHSLWYAQREEGFASAVVWGGAMCLSFTASCYVTPWLCTVSPFDLLYLPPESGMWRGPFAYRVLFCAVWAATHKGCMATVARVLDSRALPPAVRELCHKAGLQTGSKGYGYMGTKFR